MNNRVQQIFKSEFRFGLGGVALGNEFEFVTDAQAQRTMEASWEAGVRYYDVSPWYGLGEAERRFGRFLHNQPRDSYVLSTKVGKLLKASQHNEGKKFFPLGKSPNNVIFEYTADAVRRSVEDSLQRLGIDRIDILFVHDISPDNGFLPKPWEEEFSVALKGAFPELSRMRDEGIIKAWGVGVNSPEPIVRVIQESDPDVCLLASQYSLVDHQNALTHVFPVARKRGVGLVMGSALNAGFISGSARYNYGDARWSIPRERIVKRDRLRAVSTRFGVDLRTAALHFAAAPDVAAALIVGARSEEQVLANASSMKDKIPEAFWQELKSQRLIEQDAPVPGRDSIT
ncbi:L-fucose dehydrogenase (plasmid) [Burkholderia sp. THE68]|uniref:aldo/keto reductase n=1 Tax=Burkholderia sp. THE68 TaxID=758782 RepID=UPI0013193D2B|nr:aldo/keto reductase [Burkholderia sp. THE68]BBU33544.1 L-fucose dehydrogenase [Burkholderia sp. THE68]